MNLDVIGFVKDLGCVEVWNVYALCDIHRGTSQDRGHGTLQDRGHGNMCGGGLS